SDVGRTGTIARDRGDGAWSLHGTKWFTSATTADVALALARPERAEDGSRGLSLFLLELRNPDGAWNGITVRRLKDKLGTRALPTAELDLDGTVAVPVGGIGNGVRKISAMLNVTRLHTAAGSNGGVGLGLSIARDYAFRREAFGRLLADLPLHRVWMAELTAEYEAMTVLGFRAAQLVGAAERRGDALLARIVLPLAKMSVCSRGVWAASQLVESFGGMGYLEDTGLPRILRDSQVQSIWEGTTSVMALDVMRALLKESAAEAFIEDIERAVGASGEPLLEGPVARVREALDELKVLIKEPSEEGARRLAWAMARTYQGALLCEAASWAQRSKDDPRTAHAAQLFTARQLIGPAPAPSN
ncbi:MAG: acyl-CoA dehydrogenase family protein, partial [Gaiellaceae bacterium]